MAEEVRGEDMVGLRRFSQDFPQAKLYLVHPEARRWHDRGIDVIPFLECVLGLDEIL